METSKKELNIKVLKENSITLKNLLNLDQDMEDFLGPESTLHYNNCTSLKIIISSKINKIIFENCKDIELKLYGLITGIDIIKSNNIFIDNSDNKSLNKINICESNIIKVSTSKSIHKQTEYEINNSYGVIVQDHCNKSLKV